MPANTIGYSTRIERPLNASIRGYRATTGMVRTILTRCSRLMETCAQWPFAMEPWQFDTFDMPEFRKSSAAERSASIARLKNTACPIQRTYRAVIYNEDGTGERTLTFEESATLLDAPIGIAADATLGHLAATDLPGDRCFIE